MSLDTPVKTELRAKAAQLWEIGAELWAAGDKLWLRGEELGGADGSHLRNEGDRLQALGADFWSKSQGLKAQADGDPLPGL
jgi:hypothetical protein